MTFWHLFDEINANLLVQSTSYNDDASSLPFQAPTFGRGWHICLDRIGCCAICLRCHLYKPKVLQELKPSDYIDRLQFFEKAIRTINGDSNFGDNVMSDEYHQQICKE